MCAYTYMSKKIKVWKKERRKVGGRKERKNREIVEKNRFITVLI